MSFPSSDASALTTLQGTVAIQLDSNSTISDAVSFKTFVRPSHTRARAASKGRSSKAAQQLPVSTAASDANLAPPARQERQGGAIDLGSLRTESDNSVELRSSSRKGLMAGRLASDDLCSWDGDAGVAGGREEQRKS